MEQLVIGKYPADSFCLWDGDELIARNAIYIFASPEDMLLQLKIALIAYNRGNHLPYLYVMTGIKILLRIMKLNMEKNNIYKVPKMNRNRYGWFSISTWGLSGRRCNEIEAKALNDKIIQDKIQDQIQDSLPPERSIYYLNLIRMVYEYNYNYNNFDKDYINHNIGINIYKLYQNYFHIKKTEQNIIPGLSVSRNGDLSYVHVLRLDIPALRIDF